MDYAAGWKNGFLGIELIIDETSEYTKGYEAGSELRDYLDENYWRIVG